MSNTLYLIPEITNPLGRYWTQPDRKNILIDENVAIMDKISFDTLYEYSTSEPSGLYVGKMWKSKYNDYWCLRWVEPDPDPGYLKILTRKIVLL